MGARPWLETRPSGAPHHEGGVCWSPATDSLGSFCQTIAQIIVGFVLPTSLDLDVRRPDDRPPLLDLGLVLVAKRLRGLLLGRRNLLAEIGQPRAHRRIGERI